MATKHIDKRGRVVDGAAPWETQTRSKLAEKIGNLRAARKAGARPEGGMKLDNPDMARRTEIHQMSNPRTGRSSNGVRPVRGIVFARRDPAYTSTAVIIPDGANYYASQVQAAFYTVLSVGPGVESVRPGDRVLASAAAAEGDPMRSVLGEDEFALRAPEYRCGSNTQHPHGSPDAWRDEDPCKCTGMILAVVEG